MSETITERLAEAEELQPMVEPMEGTAVPAEPAEVAAAPAVEAPVEAPVEDASSEALEAPVEIDMPEVESATGDIELTDQQIAEIEAAKKDAEVDAAVDLSKKITAILNSEEVATAMETGETALNTVLPVETEEAPAEEEEGVVPMVQSAEYTDTELEMLKEYRENYDSDISDEELVAKYREFVEDKVSFEEEAAKAIEEANNATDNIIEEALDTEVNIEDAAETISITEGYVPESEDEELVEDFASELPEEEEISLEEIEAELAEEESEKEEDEVEEEAEDDSEILDKIMDFLSKYDLEEDADVEDISDVRDELESDLQTLYAIDMMLNADTEEAPVEEAEEVEVVEEEVSEEEAPIEEEAEEEIDIEELFSPEEDEEMLIEKRLASRRRLLENHRRHFREEASPRRTPCPRPTRDFDEDEDTISLAEAFDTERARGQYAMRKNESILSKKYTLNYGTMDYYTKENLSESCEEPEVEEVKEVKTVAPARKRSYALTPSRREMFAESVEFAENEAERPSRTVAERREALAKARRVREREAQRRKENPRFKEALNQSSRLSEEKEVVDPNSWKANRFIDKYNESIEFSFDEFLRNGFLG